MFLEKRILLIVLSTMSIGVSAQMVVQADSAQLQPQVRRDENGFSSCGVRGVVVVSRVKYLDAYDFSAMVSADIPYGTLKAGKTRTLSKDANNGYFSYQPVTPPPVKFWFVQENEGRPVSPIKVFPSESKGYILETADLEDTFRGILSMIDGDRMQFAVRYKNEPIETVIAFSAKMPDHERIPLLKCFKGVAERM